MVFPPPTTIRILSQLTRSSRSNRVTRVSECWSRSRTVTITRPVPTLFPKPSSHPFSSMAPVDYKSPSYLPSYVAIPPKGEHKATVIFTHVGLYSETRFAFADADNRVWAIMQRISQCASCQSCWRAPPWGASNGSSLLRK